MQTDPMIAALLRERAGYVARGLPERVEQVDEQLRLHGYEETPAGAAPQGRTADSGQQTADKVPPQRGRGRPRKQE